MRVEPSGPPSGCTWERYLEQLVAEHGGWSALVDRLIRRAGKQIALPDDPLSIERALRRLRSKGHAPGGQYGRWLLKYFGVPKPLDEVAKWMGQYHGRFADLPLAVQQAQLLAWDRPPIAESPAAVWVHLGLASVAMRRGDLDEVRAWLARAQQHPSNPEAKVEAVLLEARLLGDRLDANPVDRALEVAAQMIASLPPGIDRDCYQARVVDQRAYQALHAPPAPRFAEAVRLYRSINARSPSPFAAFRRDHGLAYCAWKQGHQDEAERHSSAALEHAADAGLLRFRVMALELRARIIPAEAAVLRRRAAQIAAELNQADRV